MDATLTGQEMGGMAVGRVGPRPPSLLVVWDHGKFGMRATGRTARPTGDRRTRPPRKGKFPPSQSRCKDL